jgi:hypothetical protein
MCSPRVVVDGQRIHASAFDFHTKKAPAVKPPHGYSWIKDGKKKAAQSTGAHKKKALDWTKEALREAKLLEEDPYASISIMITELESGGLSEENRGILSAMLSSGWRLLQIVSSLV